VHVSVVGDVAFRLDDGVTTSGCVVKVVVLRSPPKVWLGWKTTNKRAGLNAVVIFACAN
jgi:hypothetical protein